MSQTPPPPPPPPQYPQYPGGGGPGEPQYPGPGGPGGPQYPGPGWYGPYGPYGPQRDQPQATLALVLGIAGLVTGCLPLSPFAWGIGHKSMREVDQSAGTLGGRGRAEAGMILGIVGTVFLGLAVLFLVLGLAVTAGNS